MRLTSPSQCAPLSCGWAILFAVAASSVNALVIQLPSTGTDAAGNLLPGGSPDPHYQVIGPGIPAGGPAAVYSPASIWNQWLPNDPHSGWIGWKDSFSTSPYGNYTYSLTINLSGLDPATASLNGAWAADQDGSIKLNGIATGVSLGDGNWDAASHPNLTPFTISSGFQAGLNTLEFIVREPDDGDGLRVRSLVLTINSLPTFLAADFEEDHDVDGADLARWKTNFGLQPGAVHAQGDANSDGTVDGADWMIWQRQLGSTSITTAAHAVPEPDLCSTTAAMILAATHFILTGRRMHAP